MPSPTGVRCHVCQHPKRHQIEIALVHHVGLDTIARRFGLGRDAVYRHSKNHLSPQVRAAMLAGRPLPEVDLEALQTSESEGLLSSLVMQRARLQVYIDQALDLGDARTAIAAERGVVSNLELTAKLLGQLVQHHEVHSTSILISADYLALRSAIVNALRPFPKAAKAVGQALHAHESKAAEEIKNGKPFIPPPLMIEAKAEVAPA